MLMKSAAGFVQDDYKSNSHLTLTFGLRYEYNFPAIEERNILANMDLSKGVANAQVFVSGNTPVGGYPAAGTNQLYGGDKKQLAPRFGFAYTPKENWVIRGGYGIFYQLILEGTPQGLHYTVPFQYGYTIVGDGKNININDALVTGLTANVPSFTAFPSTLKAGMIQQFSLGFQHQLPWQVLVDASYVGTRGRDIDASEPVNTPPPGPGTVQTRRLNRTLPASTSIVPATQCNTTGLRSA